MILGKWPTWRTILFFIIISILYMFRATSCSSSGESIVSIHLVYVTLCRWPFVYRSASSLPICTRNESCISFVTLRNSHVTMHGPVNIKFNTYYLFWVSICSFRYPACNAHAPYCRLWAVRLYNIFLISSHKLHDFRKKKKKRLLNVKRVFWFSLQFVS